MVVRTNIDRTVVTCTIEINKVTVYKVNVTVIGVKVKSFFALDRLAVYLTAEYNVLKGKFSCVCNVGLNVRRKDIIIAIASVNRETVSVKRERNGSVNLLHSIKPQVAEKLNMRSVVCNGVCKRACRIGCTFIRGIKYLGSGVPCNSIRLCAENVTCHVLRTVIPHSTRPGKRLALFKFIRHLKNSLVTCLILNRNGDIFRRIQLGSSRCSHSRKRIIGAENIRIRSSQTLGKSTRQNLCRAIYLISCGFICFGNILCRCREHNRARSHG